MRIRGYHHFPPVNPDQVQGMRRRERQPLERSERSSASGPASESQAEWRQRSYAERTALSYRSAAPQGPYRHAEQGEHQQHREQLPDFHQRSSLKSVMRTATLSSMITIS